jgi:formylglycine-generating enzyme required for sulfatase activity
MSTFLKKSILSDFVIICFLFSFGCNKNPATPTTGTIQGQVTNATGDTLIAGVNVSTTPPTSMVSTDAQGKYTITGVSPGEYTVEASKGSYKPGIVNITVAAGQATTADIDLGGNNPPGIPTLISPANGATDQSTIITLRWLCTDLDGDSLVYDVYFGKTTPPTSIVSTAQKAACITRGGLENSRTYYWKIVAKDNREGTLTIGKIWSFTPRKNQDAIAPETLAVQLGLVRPIVMKVIPAGTFTMGSDSSADQGASPPHQVTLSAFMMQETQVTQEQYLAVMGTNPSRFDTGAGASLRPVDQVSWNAAVYFCNVLSKLNGLDTVYNTATWTADLTKNGFRLPTEAQWEYACRAGSSTEYWWGPDTNGLGARTWWYFNCGKTTQPVGTKLQNSFGLYDMTGNIRQWCNDWFGNYSPGAAIDPTGPASGMYRVQRGGSWIDDCYDALYGRYAMFSSAGRAADNPIFAESSKGFRISLPR